MKAVQIIDGKPTFVNLLEPSGDGVKVKVVSASICGTDMHLIPMGIVEGRVLGHEFAGYTPDGTAVAIEPALLLLAEIGCRVTVADILEEGGCETVEMITSAGGQARFVKTDISDESSVRQMVEFAVRTYGKIHGACNNAAVGPKNKPLHELTAAEWDRCHSITGSMIAVDGGQTC